MGYSAYVSLWRARVMAINQYIFDNDNRVWRRMGGLGG